MLRNINDIYRFTIHFPTVGPVEVMPTNSSIEWEWSREDDQIFYRKTLTTELVFEDKVNENIFDFTNLYNYERSPDRCDNLKITIEKKCEDVWYLWYEGELNMVDGKWDPDRCEVSISPRPLDKWTCIENAMKKDVNLFDLISDRKALTNILARVEKKTCEMGFGNGYPNQPGIPFAPFNRDCISGDDWSVLKNTWTFFYPSGNIALVDTTWIREIYEFGNQYGPPAGNGWTDRGNGIYTREIQTHLVDTTFIPAGPNVVSGYEYEIDTYEPVLPLTGAIDNGLHLNDVIEALFGECVENVVSDFYGINPDGTAPDNHPYQKSAEECQRLYAYQITDIKDIDASNNASKFPMSIEKLLSNLKTIHNVYAGFDDDGNLRIEHVTYWKGKYMLDLTQDDIKEHIAGHYKYEYDKVSLPQKETWLWMDTTRDEDFAGLPVTYSSCVSDEDPEEKAYSADYTVTDIISLRKNIDQYSDDGMVLIAASEEGLIARSECILSGEIKHNGTLSFGNLLYNYHRWRRPQNMGVMNGQDEPFFDRLPVRTQDPITIPICCADQLSFDPKDFIKTQMGWGEVDSAKLTDPEGYLELELKHV